MKVKGRNRSAGTMRSEQQLSAVFISKAVIPLSARIAQPASRSLPDIRVSPSSAFAHRCRPALCELHPPKTAHFRLFTHVHPEITTGDHDGRAVVLCAG
jgi:hypothetical protein